MTQPAKLSPYVNPLARLAQIDDINIHKSSISKNLIQYSLLNRIIEKVSKALGFDDFKLDAVLKSLEAVAFQYEKGFVDDEGVNTLKTKTSAIYDLLKSRNPTEVATINKSRDVVGAAIERMEKR